MESAAEYKWRTYWLHVRREGGERGERERERERDSNFCLILRSLFLQFPLNPIKVLLYIFFLFSSCPR